MPPKSKKEPAKPGRSERKVAPEISQDERYGLILKCVTPFVLYKRAKDTDPIEFSQGKWTKFDWKDCGDTIQGCATCRVDRYDDMRLIILRLGDGNLMHSMPFASEKSPDGKFTDLKMMLELPAIAHIKTLELHQSIAMWKKEDKPCRVCSKPTTSKCARCYLMQYCGPACQGKDHRFHREVCKLIAGV